MHCVVTSPPYWGLRDYGVEPTVWGGDADCEHEWTERRWYTEQSAAKSNGSVEAFSKPGPDNAQRLKDARWRQAATCGCGAWRGAHGLEPSFDLFVQHQVLIFREVWRVLRRDGTLWLNMGDSYTSGGRATWRSGASENKGQDVLNDMPRPKTPNGLKAKDLIGIPWRVAFALQADGWYLRQDIIWSKPNPMPESVTDRCTKSHEYIFLLSKSHRYHYDAEAVLEEFTSPPKAPGGFAPEKATGPNYRGGHSQWEKNRTKEQSQPNPLGRNKRSVWEVATSPFTDAHFATFPPALIEPCILAGCPVGGTVLDPFGGAGTTGLVADRLGRNAVLVELNPDYADMAERRIANDAGMFASIKMTEDGAQK